MNSSKNFNLIVPAAADKAVYEERMPSVFMMDTEGTMRCVRSILGLNLDVFDNIYFTILRKHAERYDIDALLSLQFRRLGLDKVKIVILDEPTATQAETIVRTIKTENIDGAIFIKDADSYFKAEIYPENGVSVYPLEALELVDPRHKSYVAVDDMQHITNIIEKRIVSNLFSAGGYCFENVDDFMSIYDKLSDLGNIYLSHLIYALLLDGHLFRPVKVTDYQDCNI
ncbi:MAG: hypothetical protein HDS67_05485 [Bacteroidales bacterium]|nr:hypothetical protein [Bacteroidales bacterium]